MERTVKRLRSHVLTHLADGEGALVAGADLAGSTSREVEEFDQSRHHLILLLGVTETTVAAEAPAEDPLLGVQHQLHTSNTGGVRVQRQDRQVVPQRKDKSRGPPHLACSPCDWPRRPRLGPPRWAPASPGRPWTSR